MFYAMSDRFTGNHPKEYTTGFANTKVALAFHTKKERDKWLAETKLIPAKAITREEAIKLTKWHLDEKRCEIYGESNEHVICVKRSAL